MMAASAQGQRGKLAVVVPRYGAGIAGGAAHQGRGFAQAAAARGWQVEVWTSCAQSHYDWHNNHPAGVEQDGQVTVRRFPITQRPLAEHSRLEDKLVHGRGLEPKEQYAWLHSGVHSAPLYAHVKKQAARVDLIVALPYASTLVQYATWSAPDKVMLWPCLHDEAYAYMETTRLLLEGVWGVTFNSPEEGELALERLQIQPRRQAVLGQAVALTYAPREAGKGERPLLYVGRLEGGKNLSTLYEYVRRYYEEGGGLRLQVAGQGPLQPPRHVAFEHLGFVSEEEKAAAYGAALALCQPSLMESFSLTIMESWLAGRPALVHGNCAVTRGHVARSQGGLWFHTYEEFVAAVEWLRAHPDLAARMGRNGRTYVEANYTWPAMVERFEQIVGAWQRESTGEGTLP